MAVVGARLLSSIPLSACCVQAAWRRKTWGPRWRAGRGCTGRAGRAGESLHWLFCKPESGSRSWNPCHWLAWVGLGCPLPGLGECWNPRSTSSAGSPCSERLPLEQGRLPAVCLQGGVSRPTLGRRHRDRYFRGACVAWWASVFWIGTYNWGWRCRAWYRCHCHSSLPWKRGLALAPGGPGGRTIGHHYGCWRRCWRGYCCWNGLSTEVHLWNACWESLCQPRPAWRDACCPCFQSWRRAGPGLARATEALQEKRTYTGGWLVAMQARA